MSTFSVKNFDELQHYKDRNPPWIKLYNKTLQNYQFAQLPDASKMHLVSIWLLASRTGNAIPYDEKWIEGQIGATEKIDLKLLARAGFIQLNQSCSKSLADVYQMSMPEKEAETELEIETDNPPIAPPTSHGGLLS